MTSEFSPIEIRKDLARLLVWIGDGHDELERIKNAVYPEDREYWIRKAQTTLDALHMKINALRNLMTELHVLQATARTESK